MEPTPLHPEELLAHAGWLRALAARLVGWDTSDDVLQETWVTALENPPRSRKSLPAWLARVTRNAALQRRRSEKARGAREARSARPDVAATGQAVLERAELHRTLVDEVLALDDPYRTVLLLRWFEDHEPGEIAEVTGASPATVRSQLKRGHEKLRERLDARWQGDRAAWMSALLPIAQGGRHAVVAGGAGSAFIGVLLMSLKSAYVLPLLLVLLLAGGAYLVLSDGDAIGPAGLDTDVPLLDGPDERVLERQTTPPVLFGRASTPRPSSDAVLTARVMDVSTGKPVANAKVIVAGAGDAPRRQETDGDGRFRVAELAAPAAYMLRIEAAGRPVRVLPRVRLASGAEEDLGAIWLGATGSVAGIVIDEMGRPISGAHVRAYRVGGGSAAVQQNLAELLKALDREPVALGETRSKRDGTFDLTGVPPGIVTVAADAPGLQGARVQTGVASDESGASLEIRLSAGHRLEGIVVDERGQPLSRVRIAAVPRAADMDAVLYGRQFAWSDARGRFAFDGLPGGDGRILATKRDRPTVLTKVNAETQDELRVVLPEAAMLLVRLRAPGTGEPLDGAHVVMITGRSDDLQEHGPLGILSGVTGADGTVTFEAVPGHVKMAMFAHDTYGSARWVGQLAGMDAPGVMDGPRASTIAPGRSTMDFTFPEGILVTGRITSGAGAALGGAQVYVTRQDSPESRPIIATADGRYSVRMQSDAEIVVRAAGFWQPRASSKPGLVFGQQGPHEHDIVMQPAQVVTGRVRLPDGRPAVGALVRLPSAEVSASGSSRLREAFVRADGRFLFEGVAPTKGRRVLVRAPGFADTASEPFDVSTGNVSRVADIQLRRQAALMVRVMDSKGAPLAGAQVSAWYTGDTETLWNLELDYEAPSMTGAEGRVRLGQRALGTYELQVEHHAYMPHRQSVDLSSHAGGTVEIEVRLVTGRTVRGRVVDSTGRGLADVELWWMSKEGAEKEVNRRVETETDGTYVVAGLPDQTMLVNVSLEGYHSLRLDVDTDAAESDFTLSAVDEASAARALAIGKRLKELLARGDPGDDAERAAEIQRLFQELADLKKRR